VSEWFPTDLDFRKGPTLRTVVAYEDSEAGQHARNVCDYLIERLGPNCRLIGPMWGFDVLGIPECRELAAKGAASADIIILSSHGLGDLPGDVKAWIELWLRDKGDLQTLVALFDRPRNQPDQYWPIQDYLASVAERGQIRFFAEPDAWPGKGPYQIALPLEPRFEGSAGALLHSDAMTNMSRDAAHWGINE
jgi:hypothetical protein